MTQEIDNKSQSSSQQCDQTPGRALRAAREAKDISAESIRVQLGLTRSLFDALENDDVGRLPDPVFVRGYLSRYAALVGLRTAPILASYRRLLEARGLVEKPEPGNPESDRPVAAMVASALGFLLATSLVFGAILTDGANPDGAAAGTEMVAPESQPAEVPAEESIPDKRRLEMAFITDSWVEVVDARDHILAVSLQRSGSELELEGLPPFRIKLGYGPGVNVTYLNETVELETDPATHAVDMVVGSAGNQ